jgi:capsular exopolysaccharide synthesis family protein
VFGSWCFEGEFLTVKTRPALPSDEGEDIHLRDYLGVLLRYRWSAIFSFALVVALGMALAYLTPKRYRGRCTVAIIRSDPDVQVDRPAALLTGKDAFFETQLQILESRPVYEATVRQLGLEDQEIVAQLPYKRWIDQGIRLLMGKGLETGGRTKVSVHRKAKSLKGLISIRRVKGSDVVRITSTAGTPEMARDIANAVADSFARWSLRFKREKLIGDQKYLREKLRSTKEDLIDAENELRQFEDARDAISLQKRIEYITTLRIQGEGELSDVRRQFKEVEAKLGPLLKQLSSARKGVARATAEAYTGLQKTLLDLRLKRSSLLKAYTPEHPDVRRVEDELAMVHAKVSSAENALVKGESGSVSGMESVVKLYNSRLQELEGLRSREASLKQLMKNYQIQLKAYLALKSQYTFLEREVTASQRVYDLLLIRQKEASLKADMQISDVRVLEPAILNRGSITTKKRSALALSVVLGIFAAVFAVFFRSYADSLVHDGRKLERQLGLPCLAHLPKISKLSDEQKLDGDLGVLADPIIMLGLSQEMGTPDDPAKVYLVTSPGPAEGKSTVSSSLAISFAQGGERTLLIDCDLRRPRLHRIFHTLEGQLTVPGLLKGVPEVLPEQAGMDGLSLVIAGDIGDHSPVQYLGRQAFAQVLMQLRSRFDRIILDSPPVNIVSDALHLAPLADRVLVVARAERSTTTSIENAVQRLSDVRGRIAGIVVNGIESKNIGGYGYGYGSGYGYGYKYSSSEKKDT